MSRIGRSLLILFWVLLVIQICLSGCSRSEPVLDVAPTSHLTDREAQEMAWACVLQRGTPMQTARTGSMQPILGGKEWCVVDTSARWEDIEPGMMVVYRSQYSQLPVAHRVYRKQGNLLTMCGQSLDRVDPFPVHQEDVVGVIVAVIYYR